MNREKSVGNILWDRLAGELNLYVENYALKKSGGGALKLRPSYNKYKAKMTERRNYER